MKPVLFENIISRERVLCDNTKNIVYIDGEEYYYVHYENQSRMFLVNRKSLVKVEKVIR